MQTPLGEKLHAAKQALDDFQPINRTIASREAIKRNEAEKETLQQAVYDANLQALNNQQMILATYGQSRELAMQFRKKQDEELYLSPGLKSWSCPARSAPNLAPVSFTKSTGSRFMMGRQSKACGTGRFDPVRCTWAIGNQNTLKCG